MSKTTETDETLKEYVERGFEIYYNNGEGKTVGPMALVEFFGVLEKTHGLTGLADAFKGVILNREPEKSPSPASGGKTEGRAL